MMYIDVRSTAADPEKLESWIAVKLDSWMAGHWEGNLPNWQLGWPAYLLYW